MRTRTLPLALLGVALLASACGTGDDGTEAQPTVTETVTVTASPTEASPAPTPSPTGTAGGPLAAVCADVEAGAGESLAFIFVTDPGPGREVSPGFTVSGCSNTFEAAYEWELLGRDGAVLASGFGTASCGTGCVGTFEFPVDYSVDELQVGTLRVFTTSAEDGSVTDLNAIPLRLTP